MKRKAMSDKEIIDGLINRDNRITGYFLEKYKPLFLNAISLVFNYPVDKDECINDLYLYLMDDDASRLRSFEGRSSLGAWLKRVVVRFFITLEKSKRVIEDTSHESPFEKDGFDDVTDTVSAIDAKEDLERLFKQMNNKRYVMIIRALVLEDREPECIARSMGITVANLYNIKKRALASLAKVAMKERNKYEGK